MSKQPLYERLNLARRRTPRRVLCGMVALGLLATPALGTSPEASDQLAQARTVFHSQGPAAAVPWLEAAVELGLTGSDLADARHLLGSALNHTQRWSDAINVLEAALAEPTPIADHLHFELARALSSAGSHEAAARTLAKIDKDPLSPLRMDAAHLRSLALLAAKKPRQARRALESFLDSWPDSPNARDARVELAAQDAAAGKANRAVGVCRDVVREAPRSRAGQKAGALLESLASAGNRAAKAGSLSDRLSEAEWLLSERRFTEAQPGLERLRLDAEADKRGSLATRAGELLVRAYLETWQEAKALEVENWLRSRGVRLPNSKRARLRARLGEMRKAEKVILDSYGGKKTSTYWKELGELRVSFGQYKRAYGAFYKAKKGRKWDKDITTHLGWCLLMMGKADRAIPLLRPPRSRHSSRSWSRYWYGRALQMAGRTAEALPVFEQLAADQPLRYYGIQAASRVTELKAAAKQEPSAALQSEGAAIASQLPPTVSAPPQASSPPAAPGDAVPAIPPATAAGKGSIAWPPATLAPPWEDAPKPLQRAEQIAALEALTAEFAELAPEAVRALAWARLGFVEKARNELRVIERDVRAVRRDGVRALTRRGRSDLLDHRRRSRARGGAPLSDASRRDRKEAREFRSAATRILSAVRAAQATLGEPHAKRRLALAGPRLGAAPTDDNRAQWKETFPLAYPELVKTFARQHNVPAYFVYAIMTVESGFYPHAVSVADAYGLLQVIPKTGRRVAAELGFAEFSPELLLQPEVSIYFGTYYLGQLLMKFRGQELLAAAGYNGGPHRVARWVKDNPNRPLDVFVEEIPYRQTRAYAQRVLEYVAKYRAIYEGDLTYISNRLDAAVGLHPNY